MTTNRLAKSTDVAVRIVAPSDKRDRERFWIDRGNRILWGQEPTSKGEYFNRTDLEWRCNNGVYYITKKGVSDVRDAATTA